MRKILAVFRGFLLLSWFLFIVITGLFYVVIWNQQPNRWLHIFWKVMALILNLKIRIKGPLRFPSKTVLIANHISYLDIVVTGAVLNPVFIGKKEIQSWPVFGFAADKVAGIFYMDRRLSQVVNEKKRLISFIQQVSRPLLFFPEGTTTEGVGVGEFKGALFDMLLEAKDATIQAVTLRYTHIEGREISTKKQRRVLAWYNDADPKHYPAPSLLKHLWTILQVKEISVEVRPCAHKIKVSDFSNRRDLTQAVHAAVQENF